MVYQLAEQDADILAKFSVSTEGEKGVLTLTKPLDFEEKSLYQVSQFCQVPMKSMLGTTRVIILNTIPGHSRGSGSSESGRSEHSPSHHSCAGGHKIIIVTIAIPIMIR